MRHSTLLRFCTAVIAGLLLAVLWGGRSAWAAPPVVGAGSRMIVDGRQTGEEATPVTRPATRNTSQNLAPAVTPRPYTGVPSGPPPTIVYRTPAISSLSGIWIGELTTAANIRRGPGLDFAVDRVWSVGRRVLVYSTTLALNGQVWYHVSHYPDPSLYVHTSLVRLVAGLPLPAAPRAGHWIDVNLTRQTLIACADARPVLLAQVSPGKAGDETGVGTWRIYARLSSQDMDGGTGPRDPYYNLKAVPWVLDFHPSGEALHGTYWHDGCGRPRSHGGVNLSQEQARWL